MQETMLFGVKHPGHSLVAASDAGLNSSRIFYVREDTVSLSRSRS